MDAQDRTEQFINVLSKEKAHTEENKDDLLKVQLHYFSHEALNTNGNGHISNNYHGESIF